MYYQIMKINHEENDFTVVLCCVLLVSTSVHILESLKLCIHIVCIVK